MLIRDDGEAFDPEKYATPNLIQMAEKRLDGGFGIHLMRSLMDRVEYRRRGRFNEVALTKYVSDPAQNGSCSRLRLKPAYYCAVPRYNDATPNVSRFQSSSPNPAESSCDRKSSPSGNAATEAGKYLYAPASPETAPPTREIGRASCRENEAGPTV